MNKILAGFFAFLLWIMPWWTGLFNMRERYAFDDAAVSSKIITCVKTRNIATLESMMRPWLQINTTDLSDKINQLCDAIDGNVIEFYRTRGQGSRDDSGIHSEELSFVIDTDKPEHYYFVIWYDVTNSRDRSEVGISSIRLATGLVGASDRVIHFELRVP